MSCTLGIDIGGTSIKAAMLENGIVHWESRSRSYSKPDRLELIAALHDLIAAAPTIARTPTTIGLCAPGLLATDGQSIALAVNVPGLIGLRFDDLLRAASIRQHHPDASISSPFRIVTDSFAAAFDYYHLHRIAGRLLAISIGTGVGACVLDDGKPLIVTGAGPGHLGQVDVSGIQPCDESVPVGPDGGRGSLEAYIGLAALRVRYGEDIDAALTRLNPAEPPCLALVQALRIAHALYRPHSIVLLGGIGIRLAGILPELRAATASQLTSLARDGWSLHCGETDFHAARGAARLAAEASHDPATRR